jgi:hypothetical protein
VFGLMQPARPPTTSKAAKNEEDARLRPGLAKPRDQGAMRRNRIIWGRIMLHLATELNQQNLHHAAPLPMPFCGAGSVLDEPPRFGLGSRGYSRFQEFVSTAISVAIAKQFVFLVRVQIRFGVLRRGKHRCSDARAKVAKPRCTIKPCPSFG